jgi:hypothetical protein
MSASPGSLYCLSHAKNTNIVASALAAELSQAADSLGAPEDVNRVLAKIFLALAEDRLSTRKAAVLGYLGQMLLRSHREIAFHKKLADEEAARETEEENLRAVNSWTIPRPIRDADPIAPPVQAVAETDNTVYGAVPPAVTAPSQGPASSANLECGPPTAGPLSQQPAPPTNHDSTAPVITASHPTPAPAKKTSTTKPFSDPSQPYPPLADLNHFYPRDPTLRPGLQQPRNTTVYPDEEELRWRELSRRCASTRRRTL